MQNISTLIVDDEKHAINNIKAALSSYPNWSICGELKDAEKLIENILKLKPNVVFLDINMPKKNGIEAMKELSALNIPPLVVFVSAYDHYAIDAFELHSLDYLLKPFDDARFKLTVQRVENTLKSPEQLSECIQYLKKIDISTHYLSRLLITSIGSMKIVNIRDVLWFRGSGNYVEVICENSALLHRTSLSYLEEKLDPKLFVRTHRSSIVKIDAIQEVLSVDKDKYEIILSNSDHVRLGANYRQFVLAILPSGF